MKFHQENNKPEVIILSGAYGSGKSEVALQLAFRKSREGKKVFIGDLDVVNIYFRSREREELLNEHNIEVLGNVLGSDLNNDIPHISPNVLKPLLIPNSVLIVDLAGTEVGLRVLNSLFADKEFDYNMYVVVNPYRDGTQTEEDIKSIIDKLNDFTRFRVSGLINNSNMLEYTTKEDVIEGYKLVKKVSDATNLPIVLSTVVERHADVELENKLIMEELYLRKDWQGE